MDLPPVPSLLVMSPPCEGDGATVHKLSQSNRILVHTEKKYLWNLRPHLTHEIWYDSVKDGVFKPKTSLSGTENPEVLSGLGDNM